MNRTATVWVTTCDFCERATIEFDGELTEDELGVALNKAGWATPFFGGTFDPDCWATMRRINNR